MAEIKLIALDLDGTLLNENKDLSEENLRALEECIARGIYIVPATGRTVYGIPEPVKNIPGVRYAITINGGKVVDMEENNIISSSLMTPEQTIEIMEMAEKYPVMYDAYVEGRGVSEARFMNHLDDYGLSEGVQKIIKSTRQIYPNIIEEIRKGGRMVDKMCIFFTDKKLREEIRQLLNKRGDVLVSSSMGNNLEINGLGATKGGGLLNLAAHLGLSREETMAFGDGENDITMIKQAGLGVAMGNAAPFLKEIAGYITVSNEEDGVAAAIRKFVLK